MAADPFEGAASDGLDELNAKLQEEIAAREEKERVLTEERKDQAEKDLDKYYDDLTDKKAMKQAQNRARRRRGEPPPPPPPARRPSDRFYVAPHTDAGGRDGEAAVRLVALSVGFAPLPPRAAAAEREAPATPEEAASLLSFVTFGYFTPVVDKGAAPKRYQLSGGDVPPVAPDAGAAACLRAFEGAFDEAPASAFWLGPALAPWDFGPPRRSSSAPSASTAPSPPSTLLAFRSRGAAGTAPGATPRSVWLGLALLGLAPVGLGVCDTQRMMRARRSGPRRPDGRRRRRALFLIGWAALPGVAVVLFSMRCTTELTKRVKRRQRSMEQAWKLFYRAWFKVFRNVGTVVGFAAFATSRAAWYLALDGRAATAGTTEGFTALVLFATLRSGLAIWPQVVQIYVQASVGWERIANFLGRDDLQAGATSKSGARGEKPWIWNGTLRENILFGAPLDRNRYDAVVAACGLSRDLNELPAADETEIGEKGVNLSGGQQQRVALARAAYADSAVVLLDDVRATARAARVFEIENGRVAERDADPDDERGTAARRRRRSGRTRGAARTAS
ncbi:ATPase [Aureococcus anophagefferens]|nr:ATPase [Aureococcus anophagefferens]